MGPQGSGKTTQGERIAEFLEVKIIPAGNVLRQEIKEESDFGKKVKEIVNSGSLIPDQLMIDLMFSKLEQVEYQDGFILDGFPRSVFQAKALDQKFKIDKVFNIEISDQEAIKRLSQRRVCPNGHVFHLVFNLPRVEGICDLCGEKLSQRKDDSEEIVKKRLKIYRQETSKLLNYYQVQKKIVVFDGEKNIPLVTDEILNYLKNEIR